MVTPRILGTAQGLATGSPDNTHQPPLGYPLGSQGSCMFQAPKAILGTDANLAQGALRGRSLSRHQDGGTRETSRRRSRTSLLQGQWGAAVRAWGAQGTSKPQLPKHQRSQRTSLEVQVL